MKPCWLGLDLKLFMALIATWVAIAVAVLWFWSTGTFPALDSQLDRVFENGMAAGQQLCPHPNAPPFTATPAKETP